MRRTAEDFQSRVPPNAGTFEASRLASAVAVACDDQNRVDQICADPPRADLLHVGQSSLPIQRASWFRQRCEQVAAIVFLVALSPLLALLALAVRLSSRGDIFYRQTRSGIDGRPFQILKFRSMSSDAEDGTGAVWATKNDPRVTAIGHYLRTLHLDELPQLWNIVRGEMSFVGPRPERPEIIRGLELQIPGYRHRLDVLPGVTGLAQVNLDPDESIHSVKRKFELDIEYIFSATPLLDLRIIFTTMLKMCGIPKQYSTSLFRLRRVPVVPMVVELPSNAPWLADATGEAKRRQSHMLETVG
ncbi:sugar transferase [Rubripirellula lacrimiformis]|nr:sugar transferase [Rubripirellula lacrimiformis]